MIENKQGATLSRLRLAIFPGPFNWPLWVARECGLFARNGVDVALTEIPGSVAQWTMMADGSADLAITLMDNVVAYREGQGEAPVTVPDAIAVMASDARLMPSLIVQPDIASYAHLKGTALSVDATLTGLALLLFALLEKGELKRDEYDIVRTGGVMQRFDGIKDRRFAGSLFNTPLSSQLEAQGFRCLDTAASVVTHYQGHVVAVRSAWARRNRDTLIGFLRALSDAIDWIYEPANRDKAFGIFRKAMPNADTKAADVAYAVLFDAKSGFVRKGAIDREGVAAVLALRSRFGVPPKPMQPPETYFNLQYLDAASKV
jgi:ABC-type nitrate/sulfonate/bicarbonate transport system substrate-binding protein